MLANRFLQFFHWSNWTSVWFVRWTMQVMGEVEFSAGSPLLLGGAEVGIKPGVWISIMGGKGTSCPALYTCNCIITMSIKDGIFLVSPIPSHLPSFETQQQSRYQGTRVPGSRVPRFRSSVFRAYKKCTNHSQTQRWKPQQSLLLVNIVSSNSHNFCFVNKDRWITFEVDKLAQATVFSRELLMGRNDGVLLEWTLPSTLAWSRLCQFRPYKRLPPKAQENFSGFSVSPKLVDP